MLAVALGLAVGAGLAWAIWFFIAHLRVRNASVVYTLWYLFSLSACASLIVAVWARKVGAINAAGESASDFGKALFKLLEFVFDLNADFYVLLALMSLVVLPQVLGYMLSGLFGCASRPRFVAVCVSVFSWSMAKSFIVASGVLISISTFAYFDGWKGVGASHAMSLWLLSIMMVCLAFAVIMGKFALDEFPVIVRSRELDGMRARLGKMDGWMVRHRDDA